MTDELDQPIKLVLMPGERLAFDYINRSGQAQTITLPKDVKRDMIVTTVEIKHQPRDDR